MRPAAAAFMITLTAAACGASDTTPHNQGLDGGPPDATDIDAAPPTTGRFHASWTFTVNGAAPADPQDACDALGATWFEVLSTDSLGSGTADRFPCGDLGGLTGELPAGTYTIVESLLDASGTLIAGTDVGPFTEALPAGAVVELATINYEVGTSVHLRLFVDFGAAGGANCGTGGPMDSGVVQQQIFITDTTGDVCVLVTGIDQVGVPFTTDTCGGPEFCLETDVAQELDIPAGSYLIEVLGLKGAAAPSPYVCYQVTGFLDVAADSDLSVAVPFNPPDPPTEVLCNSTKRHTGR